MTHSQMRPAIERRLAECHLAKHNWPLSCFDLFNGRVLVVIRIEDQLYLKAAKPSDPWEPIRALMSEHGKP